MCSIVRIFSFWLVASTAAGCAKPQANIEADYVFENVNVVAMSEEGVLADKVIAVRNG